MEFFLYIFTSLLAIIIGYLLGRQGTVKVVVSDASKSSDSSSSSSTSSSSTAEKKIVDLDLGTEEKKADEAMIHTFAPTDFSLNTKRRVIVVSKQLPVSIRRDKINNKWLVEWDDHRNFIANLKVLKEKLGMDIKFVGYVGFDCPRDDEEELEEVLAEFDCVPVFLSKELASKYFNGFCKQILWPLLHYVVPNNVANMNDKFSENWDEMWQAYTAANTKYATVVSHTVESPSDWIWVHNYHLLLAPSFLRGKLPRSRIGLFIHTPFPSSDVFRLLPTRVAILSSLMQADMLGFHTFDYARHFLSCIKRVMDLDYETLPGGMLGIKYSGRFVSLLISHVGVDAHYFHDRSLDLKVIGRVEDIKKKSNGRQIILAVEDLDNIKAPKLKLAAFDRFLTKFGTQWKDKIILIDAIMPAGGSKDMQAVKQELLDELGKIRLHHGNDVIQIIDYDQLNYSNTEIVNDMVALYRASSIGLISTFWDGLNMTAYEFTAAQDPNDPGSLIVSEFMGCSRSLNGVHRVNPWSLEQVSEVISHSLNSTVDERKANHQRRYTYVMNHTVERWAAGFLQHLDRACKLGSSLNFVQVGFGSNVRLLGVRNDFTHLDESSLTIAYRKANKRVLLLDYDGTLTSAEKSAQRSKFNRPSDTVLRVLKFLCEDADNFVFIMSGRTRDTLGEWFHDIRELGLTAEKGLFIRWPERMCALRKKMIEEKKLELKRLGLDNDDNSNNNDNNENKSSDLDTPDGESLDMWEAMIGLDGINWKALALETIKAYTEMTDGSWIEDKEYAIVWHYEQADPEYGRLQAAELEKYLNKVLNNPNVDVVKYDYNRILEVKPHGVNKGIAATAILESVNAYIANQYSQASGPSSMPLHNRRISNSPSSPPSNAQPSPGPASPSSVHPSHGIEHPSLFILSAGDDRSDEDMFLAVQNRDDLKKSKKERNTEAALSTGMKKRVASNKNLAAMNKDHQNNNNNNHSDVHAAAAAAATGVSGTSGGIGSGSSKQSDPFVFTVCVGMKPSNAHYYLHDDEEVIKVLGSLATASHRMQHARNHDFSNTGSSSNNNNNNISSSSAAAAASVQMLSRTLPTLQLGQQNNLRSTAAPGLSSARSNLAGLGLGLGGGKSTSFKSLNNQA